MKGAADRISAELARLMSVGRSADAPSKPRRAQVVPAPQGTKSPLGEVVDTRWLDTQAAAAYLGHTIGTLHTYRWMGIGPRCRKIGRRMVYAVGDLDGWRVSRGDGASPGTDAGCRAASAKFVGQSFHFAGESTVGGRLSVFTLAGRPAEFRRVFGEPLPGRILPVSGGQVGETFEGLGERHDRRACLNARDVVAHFGVEFLVNTDRRTYHLELRSAEKTYMASISWAYPQDQLIALLGQKAAADASAPVATGVDINALNFRYRIEGDNPAWRPLRAFDDGRQVFIEFPAGIGQGEMPPLWVIGAEGGAELVNYRVRGNHMVVERLFAGAELRLGAKRQDKVRIVRTDGRPRS